MVIARRLVRIRLDARTDQPWRREGFRHPDLMIWVRANRARLVAACLTLCQAWASATGTSLAQPNNPALDRHSNARVRVFRLFNVLRLKNQRNAPAEINGLPG